MNEGKNYVETVKDLFYTIAEGIKLTYDWSYVGGTEYSTSVCLEFRAPKIRLEALSLFIKTPWKIEFDGVEEKEIKVKVCAPKKKVEKWVDTSE